MTDWATGDRARRAGTPLVVTVLEVGICGEDGCLEEVLAFADPVTGERDWEHAREFSEHPLNRFDREDR